MAAELAQRASRQWTPEGVAAIEVGAGLELFGKLLRGPLAQVGVFPGDWSAFMRQFPPGMRLPLLDEVAGEFLAGQGTDGGSRSEPELLKRLREAPIAARREVLIAGIQSEIATVLRLDPEEAPAPQEGFFELGMDSLMAVELRNRICSSLGQFLPATLTFQYPTVAALADHLLGEVLDLPKAESPPAPGTPKGPDTFDALSEEELLGLLSDELKRS
jgi:acyl carrier protein